MSSPTLSRQRPSTRQPRPAGVAHPAHRPAEPTVRTGASPAGTATTGAPAPGGGRRRCSRCTACGPGRRSRARRCSSTTSTPTTAPARSRRSPAPAPTGQPFTLQNRIVRADGQQRTVVLLGEPELEPSGGVERGRRRLHRRHRQRPAHGGVRADPGAGGRGRPAQGRDGQPGDDRAGQGHPHAADQLRRTGGLRPARPHLEPHAPQGPRRRAVDHRVGPRHARSCPTTSARSSATPARPPRPPGSPLGTSARRSGMMSGPSRGGVRCSGSPEAEEGTSAWST